MKRCSAFVTLTVVGTTLAGCGGGTDAVVDPDTDPGDVDICRVAGGPRACRGRS